MSARPLPQSALGQAGDVFAGRSPPDLLSDHVASRHSPQESVGGYPVFRNKTALSVSSRVVNDAADIAADKRHFPFVFNVFGHVTPQVPTAQNENAVTKHCPNKEHYVSAHSEIAPAPCIASGNTLGAPPAPPTGAA